MIQVIASPVARYKLLLFFVSLVDQNRVVALLPRYQYPEEGLMPQTQSGDSGLGSLFSVLVFIGPEPLHAAKSPRC